MVAPRWSGPWVRPPSLLLRASGRQEFSAGKILLLGGPLEDVLLQHVDAPLDLLQRLAHVVPVWVEAALHPLRQGVVVQPVQVREQLLGAAEVAPQPL